VKEYIIMSTAAFMGYEKHHNKLTAIRRAASSCAGSGDIYQVLKCVATITPKGVTVDDHEKEDE